MSEARPIVWREFRELAAEMFRCDLPGCGEQATTIHLLPWCGNGEVVGRCRRRP